MFLEQDEIYKRFVESKGKQKLTHRAIAELVQVSEKTVWCWVNMVHPVPLAVCYCVENFDIITNSNIDKYK